MILLRAILKVKMLKLVVIFACLGVSIANGFAIADKRPDLEEQSEQLRPHLSGAPSLQRSAEIPALPNPSDSNSNPENDFSLSAIFSRWAKFYEAPQGTY